MILELDAVDDNSASKEEDILAFDGISSCLMASPLECARIPPQLDTTFNGELDAISGS